MNVKLKRLLLPLLRAVKEGRPIPFRMRSAAAQAIFLIGKPASKKTSGRLRREQKRATHKEETALLRAAVIHRANGACELAPGGLPQWGTELHHLEGGSGRRALQKVSNCVWACADCHRGSHRRPEDYREVVINWAMQHGYPVPRRYCGPPKLVAAGPSKTAPSSEVSEENHGK